MTDVELVKSKIDIVSLISEFVPLKKAGRHFKANCPFHSEKSPSFIVSPERQSWHCFGACSTGGDAISFVMRWEHLEFIEALKYLAQKAGVTLSHQPQQSDQSKQKELLYEINHLASEYYHYILTSHALGDRARGYLKDRGINEHIWKTFSLGYAPNSWKSVSAFLEKKGYTWEDMETAGLVIKGQRGGYYDRFRGRLIFTLKDHRGNVVGFSGRVLPTSGEKTHGDVGAKYINTSETPIYTKGNVLYALDVTKDSIKKEGFAVVCEGEFDVLASFQSGISNIVAIKGTALTDDQLRLLSRYTQDIRLALDSDMAGNEAARRGIEKAELMGMTVRVINIPGGKDPADAVQSGAHIWKKSVLEALPIYDFLIQSAANMHDPTDVIGKRRISDMVVPFLSRIQNPIVQSHYIRLLAQTLAISEESVHAAIRQVKSSKPQASHPSVVPTQVLPRDHQIELELLSLIFESDHPFRTWDLVKRNISLDDIVQPPVSKILETLATYATKHEAFSLSTFTTMLAPELVPTFDQSFLIDISSLQEHPEDFQAAVVKCAQSIRINALRRKEDEITTHMKQEEENEEGMERLTKEFQRIRSLRLEIEKSGGNRVQ